MPGARIIIMTTHNNSMQRKIRTAANHKKATPVHTIKQRACAVNKEEKNQNAVPAEKMGTKTNAELYSLQMKIISKHITRAFEQTAANSGKRLSPETKGIFKKRQWVFS